MSILNTVLTNPAASTAQATINSFNQIFSDLKNRYNYNVANINNNKTVPVADVLTALGTNAAQVYMLGQLMNDFLSCVAVGLASPTVLSEFLTATQTFRAQNHIADFAGIVYPAKTVSINEDGTAAATDAAYAPSTY